jgi:hypothetical protein
MYAATTNKMVIGTKSRMRLSNRFITIPPDSGKFEFYRPFFVDLTILPVYGRNITDGGEER